MFIRLDGLASQAGSELGTAQPQLVPMFFFFLFLCLLFPKISFQMFMTLTMQGGGEGQNWRFFSFLIPFYCNVGNKVVGVPTMRGQNFLQFQAILNNFDFFSFLTTKIFTPPKFFWGGLKSQKIIFNQFSRYFRNFWTTLIFFIFDNKFLYAPQFF